MTDVTLGVVRVSWIVVFVAVLFVSSLVWLLRNWNAKGPTDLWKDEDLEGSRRKQVEEDETYPGRPDPRRDQQLVLIGYWRSDDEPGWPDPRPFIDPAWDGGERAMVAAHLRAGRVPWVRMGRSPCLLCASEQGSGERTDGTYLWPGILLHYLEEHDVRLPDVFVLHVRAARAGGDPGSRVGSPVPLDRATAMERADRAWWASTDRP